MCAICTFTARYQRTDKSDLRVFDTQQFSKLVKRDRDRNTNSSTAELSDSSPLSQIQLNQGNPLQ